MCTLLNFMDKPTKICSWCSKILEIGGKEKTHGICIPCETKFMKEYTQNTNKTG